VLAGSKNIKTSLLSDYPKTIEKIILISVDAADSRHLGLYGYYRKTSPNIDLISNDGIWFKYCITPSNWTGTSLSSMFTSKYYTNLKVTKKGYTTPDRSPTLTKILKDNGFKTFIIREDNYRVNKLPEINRGVDKHILINDDELKTKSAKALISKHKKIFLFLHYSAPHAHYDIHDGVKIFGNSDVDKYDNELAYVDREIGRLIDFLKSKKLYQDTLIIITSDHGEMFSHGYKYHGGSLYNPEIMVPLFFKGLGKKNSVFYQKVSSIDIFPTILNLLNIPPPEDINGVSLLPLIYLNQYYRERIILSEVKLIVKKRALIYDNLKVMVYKDNIFKIFDIDNDYKETNNLLKNQFQAGEEIIDIAKYAGLFRNQLKPEIPRLEKNKKLDIKREYISSTNIKTLWEKRLAKKSNLKLKNNSQLFLAARNQGDWAEISFLSLENCTGNLNIAFTTSPNYGIIQLYLNHEKKRIPIDLYSKKLGINNVLLKDVSVKKGENSFRIKVIGKNNNSKKFYFGIDYMSFK
jgi:arylsulfatase A-like enzyme